MHRVAIWLIPLALTWFLAWKSYRFGKRMRWDSPKPKSIFDHAPDFIGGETWAGFIFGAIVSLSLGAYVKYMPWWVTKFTMYILTVLFFVLGILCIKQMIP